MPGRWQLAAVTKVLLSTFRRYIYDGGKPRRRKSLSQGRSLPLSADRVVFRCDREVDRAVGAHRAGWGPLPLDNRETHGHPGR